MKKESTEVQIPQKYEYKWIIGLWMKDTYKRVLTKSMAYGTGLDMGNSDQGKSLHL